MRRRREEAPEFIAGQSYTDHELELIADDMLRKDSRSEMCRECGGRGTETGHVEPTPQEDFVREDGQVLVLDFRQFECPEGHEWFGGEGQARTIQGDNPILFEEHLASRRRREIYTQQGTPDPSILGRHDQPGLYHRTHPDGRPTNTAKQRRESGASFYRG